MSSFQSEKFWYCDNTNVMVSKVALFYKMQKSFNI